MKLVLRLFCDSTIAALKTLGPTNQRLPNWKGTVQFVTLILKFWNIVNVKSLFKGQRKRLDDANPIRDLNDSRISWMVSFVSWLENWKTYSNTNNTACLTNETYTALRHTVNTMVYMLYDLLSSHTLDYVIPGKFQTDNLESRFGQYRQLSGCNYLVSVAEVMQSEKKLRIKVLLKLHASSGIVNIKTFLDKFSDVKKDARDLSFITMFPMCDIGSQRQEDLSALLMVTGYVAKKTMLRMKCEACKQKLNLEIDSDLLMYFESINRGGLTYLSNFLFNVILCAYNVFNVCISKYVKEFLKVVNHKQNLLSLFEKHISSVDYFSDHLLVCDVCKVELITNVMRMTMTMTMNHFFIFLYR